MAAAWGLESGFHGVEAFETTEVCVTNQASTETNGIFWLWLAVYFMFAVMFSLWVKFFFMWKQTNRDLTSCWNQVADEDLYMAVQEKRINDLVQRRLKIEDRIEEVLAQLTDENEATNNEVSMTHDY